MIKINADLISKIKAKFASDDNAYARIRLDISKMFFALASSLYFFFYLSTIAGYQVDLFGKLLTGIYPIFLFSIFALAYDLGVYLLNTYTDKANSFKLGMICTFSIFYVLLMSVYLGFKF